MSLGSAGNATVALAGWHSAAMHYYCPFWVVFLIRLAVAAFLDMTGAMHRDSSKHSLRTLLIGMSLLLSLGTLRAQERPAQPESFATFWARFKSAVAKNDKEAVVAATHLPSIFPNNQQAKAAFLKFYPSTFTKKVQKCFAAAKPVRTSGRDSYSVFCDEQYFYFEKVNGAYKFTDFGPND
jgi:hypothetical protein